MNQLATTTSVFSHQDSFMAGMKMAEALSRSKMIPADYQGKPENTLIAIEVAQRTGASPLAVMQNLYVVHGKPGWSAQYIIAAINASGRFSPLRYEMSGEKDTRACYAWATDQAGERLESPPVTIEIAKKEGWFGKAGSKWQTMPDLMLRYRAATLFGRLYAPEILMGMQTADEINDATPIEKDVTDQGETLSKADLVREKLKKRQLETILAAIDAANTEEELTKATEQVKQLNSHDLNVAREAFKARKREIHPVSFAVVADAINAAQDEDSLMAAYDMILRVPNVEQQNELMAMVEEKRR